MKICRVGTVLGINQDEERPLPLELPGSEGTVLVYVRPHDLDITRVRNGRPAWPARGLDLLHARSISEPALRVARLKDSDQGAWGA